MGRALSLDKLEKEVREAGGRIETTNSTIRLIFGKRGFALADLSAEALKALKEFKEIIIVEEGAGEKGSNYYYYVKLDDINKLLQSKKSK